MTRTYYMVQTSPRQTMAKLELIEKYNDAERKWRTACSLAQPDAPRRYPRLLKATLNVKTIKDRR